ncbi:MAG: hypothetical protein OSB07_01970 [Dehalococcoidia bacterium]|jgi:hypothetical protein|nr:hypothetical protein [Dehalococcoidia bacterium]
MAAHSANGVETVVLGMLLFAKPSTVITASGASFAEASAGALRPFSLFICDCDH